MMYQLTPSGTSVIRASDGARIPLPPNESEGFAYQAWLDAGNTPLPVPVPTLAEKQATMWERIKAKRELLSDTGGYMVAVNAVNKWFHSDGKSKTQQLSLFIMGASVPAVQWKTMDGSFVTMTQALAAAIFQAAAAQDQAIFSAAETHNAAMQAAADQLAYDFSGGWPATFAG